MKANFKELMVEVNIGEEMAIDVRKDLGNKLHRTAGDIEAFDLGHKYITRMMKLKLQRVSTMH